MQLLDETYPTEIAAVDELVLDPKLLGGQKRAVFMGVNRETASKAGVASRTDH